MKKRLLSILLLLVMSFICISDGIYAENELDLTVINEQETGEIHFFEIKGDVLEKYNGEETEVIVPNNIREIGKKAFAENKNIKRITLPDSIEVIRESAFANCTNLIKISVSSQSRLKTIGHTAFKNCIKLDISFTEGIESIAEDAFEGVSAVVVVSALDETIIESEKAVDKEKAEEAVAEETGDVIPGTGEEETEEAVAEETRDNP